MGTLSPVTLVVTQKPLCHGEINYDEGPPTKSQSLINYPLSLFLQEGVQRVLSPLRCFQPLLS